MLTPENVKPNNWITVNAKRAVVCKIYDTEPNKIEVVHLDRDRAINEDAHFVDGKWSFVYDGPNGGYADNNPRLEEYVAKLHAGRWWEP